jgi:hypothetical protein
MEAMRETWTDARLSDFAAHTDSRFDAIDRRFDAVDRRFEAVERRMDDGFRRVDAELRALNTRFDAFQRTMLQLGGGVIVALIGLIATQL